MALKVGDKVRRTSDWHKLGTLTKIDPKNPAPYRVHWDDGKVLWQQLWEIKKCK